MFSDSPETGRDPCLDLDAGFRIADEPIFRYEVAQEAVEAVIVIYEWKYSDMEKVGGHVLYCTVLYRICSSHCSYLLWLRSFHEMWVT